MKMIVEGIMGGDLPWSLVFIGVFIAIGIEIVGVPVMPFAVGLYLPVQLNACIMIGGIINLLMNRRKNVDQKTKDAQLNDGTLYCAGMIAGRRSGWYRTGNSGSIHNRSFQSPEWLQPGCHRQHRCTGSDHSDTVEILPLG